MPINLTDAGKERERALHVRLVMQLEEEAEQIIADSLQKVANAAADVFQQTQSLAAVEMVTLSHQFQIARTLEELYRFAAITFSSRVFDAVGRKFFNRYLEIKDAQSTFDRALEAWILENAFEQAQLITDTTRKDLAKLILDAGAANLTVNETTKLIREKLGEQIAASRARTIARTETHNAATFASLTSASALDNDLDLGLKKIWLAVDDKRTRPDHSATERQTLKTPIPINDLFRVGSKRMSRPGDPNGGASQVVNCLHPDNKVWFASPNALTRRFNKGLMIVIETADGYNITVTPNHPILTDSGWVKASEIKQTDSIICANRLYGKIFGNFNIDDIIPSIEQIYNSLSIIFMRMRIAAVDVNFHGEAINENVDVVFGNGSLSNRLKSFFFDPISELKFPDPDLTMGIELCNRLLDKCFIGDDSARNGYMSFGNLIFTLFRSHQRPFKSLGLALSSRLDTGLNESSVDSTSINSQVFGNSIDRESIIKKPDNFRNMFVKSKVIEHNNFKYEGYVYNLSDEKEYYICNGIVNHNCRCALGFETTNETG